MKKILLFLVVAALATSCKNKDEDAATPGGGSGTINSGWQQLGGSLNLSFTNENIWSITTDPSNNVYISPDYFGTHDWTPYKFNGTSWSKVGNLSSSDPLEHFQLQLDGAGNLYLSNNESAVIPNSTNLTYIAKFDGSWSMVGDDIDTNVSAVSSEIPFVVLPSGRIYASFIYPALGTDYRNVVWDGNSWLTMENKYYDTVTGDTVSCDMHNGVYRDIAGNVFVDGVDKNGTKVISKYNGTSWQNIGYPYAAVSTNSIYTSCYDAAGNIYFLTQTIAPADYKICKWNGTNWTVLSKTGLPSGSNPLYTMAAGSNGKLYVAGNLTNTSGNYYVAEWNGTGWQELGGSNTFKANGEIWALAVDSRGYVLAGGAFTNSSGEAYVAVYRP